MQNSSDQKLSLYVSEDTSRTFLAILGIIAVSAVVQTAFVVYLMFLQPAPKYDSKILNVTDSVLDLEARINRVEQENIVLFRLLRQESEHRGVIPDEEPGKDKTPKIPIPPKIGDSPTH